MAETDLWDDIVVELEYDSTGFLTCDIDIEEDVPGISYRVEEEKGRR